MGKRTKRPRMQAPIERMDADRREFSPTTWALFVIVLVAIAWALE